MRGGFSLLHTFWNLLSYELEAGGRPPHTLTCPQPEGAASQAAVLLSSHGPWLLVSVTTPGPFHLLLALVWPSVPVSLNGCVEAEAGLQALNRGTRGAALELAATRGEVWAGPPGSRLFSAVADLTGKPLRHCSAWVCGRAWASGACV